MLIDRIRETKKELTKSKQLEAAPKKEMGIDLYYSDLTAAVRSPLYRIRAVSVRR